MRLIAFIVLLLIIAAGIYYFLPDKEQFYNHAAAEVKKELSFRLRELKGKIPGSDLLQNILGLASDLPRLSNLSGELPKNAGAVAETLLPLVQEVLTNTQKEEIYLKAPLNVTLPEVKIENYDQQLSVPLEAFEIKDTRRAGKPWTLIVSVSDLIGERGVISRENISLKIRNNSIEGGDSSRFSVEEGGKLTIATLPGLGKGVTKIRPWLSIKIPRDSYSGAYRADVESSLE